ncbi:indolethylamine N-methyltransferase-like isoform X2 [Rana temporaria]|uniref:indolethylamine N-methyltransferase-like isoform X2 n=1 Tax=Rana temporaria TaxID=8407 RepID=UPI001AACE197|nr:indolethylamine N-methyltransferase-like isoform X2 [Rana temporaria]
MSETIHKHYHDDDFDAKELVNTHFSHGKISIIEESMGFPTRIIHELASTGQLKGDKLLDISIGSLIYQLFSVSNIYKEIYVVQMNDDSFTHFKQWMDKDDKATDWSQCTKRVCHLEGNRQEWTEKEDQVRKVIKGVYKWDNHETNGLDPRVVPQVDFVLSLWILNVVSKTKEDFQRNLERFTSRLKLGGQVLLFVVLNMTFYKVGSHRYFCLTLDETEVQELVIKAGFIIEKSSVIKAVEPNDIVDYSHMGFVLARKVK